MTNARFLTIDRRPGWLEPELADALLAYAIAQQATYVPARLGRNGHGYVNSERRHALNTRDLGQFKPILKERARANLSNICAALRVLPFEETRVELELVAYGEGAHFRRHIDIVAGVTTRAVSMVYYLHSRPKQFTGGALRFYALKSNDSFDVEPEHNLLVAFPAFAPHSVEPVGCPHGDFADCRFAVNIWIHTGSRRA